VHKGLQGTRSGGRNEPKVSWVWVSRSAGRRGPGDPNQLDGSALWTIDLRQAETPQSGLLQSPDRKGSRVRDSRGRGLVGGTCSGEVASDAVVCAPVHPNVAAACRRCDRTSAGRWDCWSWWNAGASRGGIDVADRGARVNGSGEFAVVRRSCAGQRAGGLLAAGGGAWIIDHAGCEWAWSSWHLHGCDSGAAGSRGGRR